MSTPDLSFFILLSKFDAIQGTCTLQVDHETLMNIDLESWKHCLRSNEIRFVKWYQREFLLNGNKESCFMTKPGAADSYDQDVVCKEFLEIVDALPEDFEK